MEETTFGPATYLAIKKTISFDEMTQEFYAEIFNELFTYTALNLIEQQGQPVCLYFDWDEDNRKTTLAPGIPVSNDIASIEANNEGIEVIKVPEVKVAVADHYGPYEQLKETHEKLSAYVKENDLGHPKVSPGVIEEYVTDPANEPDESKWLTKVRYFIA